MWGLSKWSFIVNAIRHMPKILFWMDWSTSPTHCNLRHSLTLLPSLNLYSCPCKQVGKPLRILFLSSDTGGGHRAPAEALASRVSTEFTSYFHGYNFLFPLILPMILRISKISSPTINFLSNYSQQKIIIINSFFLSILEVSTKLSTCGQTMQYGHTVDWSVSTSIFQPILTSGRPFII